MSDKSGIEWTDATWNPIVGCSLVSPGCTNCYAMKMAARIVAMNEGAHKASVARDPEWGAIGESHYEGITQPSKAGPVWTGKIGVVDDYAFTKPLRWKRPRRIFVNSMGDLFHESIPDEAIDRVFAVMALAPQHTFQVLTKRSARMRAYCSDPGVRDRIIAAMYALGAVHAAIPWPLPHVWAGVSAEDQPRADERIPDLLATLAPVRFVSAEPLLGPIDFTSMPRKSGEGLMRPLDGRFRTLDWIIVGGESGPGARPMHPDWARSIRDQCVDAGVPFFFKQWGEWKEVATYPIAKGARDGVAGMIEPHNERGVWGGTKSPRVLIKIERVGKRAAGRLLDGVEHNAYPEPRP